MPILQISTGDGLGFDQNNKLTVKYTGDNIRVVDTGTETEKGLYVDDLTGISGSVSDNWSTVPGKGYKTGYPTINNFVDINRDVTNLIFTFGANIAVGRSETQITYDLSRYKTITDVCNEIVFPLVCDPSNWTSFKPDAGELLQFVTGPDFRSVSDVRPTRTANRVASESGKRLGNNTQTTVAMFVITDIQYAPNNVYWVTSMRALCIYSTIASYVVGTEYSGTTNIS